MNDYIDRQAAIDALCNVGCGSGYCGISCDDVKAIEQLPSVEVEPVKHGRWEWHNEDGWYYSCSVCGHNAYGNTDNIVSGLWAYCPNCGAKMDAEEGEEA